AASCPQRGVASFCLRAADGRHASVARIAHPRVPVRAARRLNTVSRCLIPLRRFVRNAALRLSVFLS
ncbi:hypothetical protein SB780_34455, partial [Burkholderia sp. SIMBA_057]